MKMIQESYSDRNHNLENKYDNEINSNKTEIENEYPLKRKDNTDTIKENVSMVNNICMNIINSNINEKEESSIENNNTPHKNKTEIIKNEINEKNNSHNINE
jgi:hypothetical protein